MAAIEFIATQIIGNPAILFGLIALVGLILLRRPTEEIVLGTVKTIIGFVILVAGAMLLLEVCQPLTDWVRSMLGVEGVIPQNWLVVSKIMAEHGREVGLVVTLGFIINLALARITPIKSIAVTGHIMMIWACWIVAILLGTGWSTGTVIAVGGFVCGLHYWLTPALHAYFLRRSDRLTGEYSLYVPEVTGIAVAGWLGPLVGNKDVRCADIKVPKRLEWLRDTTVGIAVVAAMFWALVGIAAGPGVVQATAGDQNWIIFLMMMGVKFAGGLAVVLYGVRMLLAEIVPAFNGIATRLVPGAIAGLDYPTLFHFAPQAVFVGFLFNLIGAVLATLVMVAVNFPVIVLPAVWMNFWTGALVGVVADAYGGRRATMIVCLVLGFVAPFLWGLGYPLSGALVGSGVVNDYTDVSSYGLLFQYIIKLIAGLTGGG
jgi:PTS system ascorbate-specific IIC component